MASPALDFRMADFAAFGWRIAEDKERWLGILTRLQLFQEQFSAEGDPLMKIIGRLINGTTARQIGPMPTELFYQQCEEIAEKHRWPFPKDPQGFSQRVRNRLSVIQRELSIQITVDASHARMARWTIIKSFNGVIPNQPPYLKPAADAGLEDAEIDRLAMMDAEPRPNVNEIEL